MGGLPSEKNTIIRHGPPKIAPLVVAGGYIGVLHRGEEYAPSLWSALHRFRLTALGRWPGRHL